MAQNACHQAIRNFRLNLLLLFYILINSHKFHYYPFAFKLDKCIGNYNNYNDLSNKVCVPNQSEDLHLCMFNMITGINELKTLTKHISSTCKYVNLIEEIVIQINGGITKSVGVSVKNTYMWKRLYSESCNVVVKMINIMDNSVIMDGEIINTETKTIPTKCNL